MSNVVFHAGEGIQTIGKSVDIVQQNIPDGGFRCQFNQTSFSPSSHCAGEMHAARGFTSDLVRCEAASRMHFARTVARRAERRLVELTTETTVRNVLLHYINRLSDCLYALARVEDNVAHQNLMIQEITKRYHEANHIPALKERTMPLTFQDLHQLIRSAAMRADELHIPVVISIVDANGTESVTWRMPDALLVSSELAPKKAWTAVAMKTATHKLADTVQPGAPLYGLESHMQGKVVTFGGGFPLWRDGKLLGGLGISGGSVEQDMDIAQSAMAAINVGVNQ